MSIIENTPAAVIEPAGITPEPESVGWLILTAFGWWLVAELVVVLAGVAVYLTTDHTTSGFLATPAGLTVATLVTPCVLLVGSIRRARVVGHGSVRAGIGDGSIARWPIVALFVVAAVGWGVLVAAFWFDVLSIARPGALILWREANPLVLAVYFGATVVLAPIAEELFFRGWLWTGLRRHWRSFPTALVACGLWLAMHIELGYLLAIVLIPVAVLIGFARHFCGLRAGLIIHVMYNLCTELTTFSLLQTPS